MKDPMTGINAYTTPRADGGMHFDWEAMLVDLVMMYKAGGITLPVATKFLTTIWDEVEVRVDTTRVKKDS